MALKRGSEAAEVTLWIIVVSLFGSHQFLTSGRCLLGLDHDWAPHVSGSWLATSLNVTAEDPFL
jgi:hypothetical protein